MALSNWLGKDEWAACYWLGQMKFKRVEAKEATWAKFFASASGD